MINQLCGATALAVALLWCASVHASAIHGKVVFAGRDLAGVQVTAHRGDKTESVISDSAGAFQFADLADGKWQIEATMQCFESLHADVEVTAAAAPLQLEMKLLSAEKLAALAEQATPVASNPQEHPALAAATDSKIAAADTAQAASTQASKPARSKDAAKQSAAAQSPAAPPHEENEQGADGFLVQGSVNNAATSSFSTNAAFGNMRFGQHNLYTGGLELTEGNAALDAQPYALSGVSAPRSAYNNMFGKAYVNGPLNIPHLMPHGPNASFRYNWSRNDSARTMSGLVPTAEERVGNLSGLANAQGQAVTVNNPATGVAYVGNQVPVAAEAAALLKLYPLPNLASASPYNYQAQVLNPSRSDGVNLGMWQQTKHAGSFNGHFGLDSSSSGNTNLFGFLDHSDALNTQAGIGWSDWFQHLGISPHANYNFTRGRTTQTPYFANRTNISGDAGISGNDQTPANWGPPSLGFASGFSGLNDGNSSNNRTRTDVVSIGLDKWRGIHTIKFGSDFRKLEFNEYGQQNPRGAFMFDGTASGSDLADFLIGIPDTSQIAYGNADKYLRQTEYDAYFVDDWRLLPNLSINIGLRWEYSAPITELFGRLVNLDVENGFSAVAPVVGSNPIGSLTGTHYPASLMNPDRSMIEPRVGLSWRPLQASSLILRAGYGKSANTSVYPNSSVYKNIVDQMTQQAPLSTSLNVQNSAACPLTLANGFVPCAATTNDTFGIDPNFRVGYAQTWKLQLQHDLPLALQVSASYLGIKGTHGAQEILPNSYAPGAVNPCPSCMVGFVYESSGGNSMRHAGEVILKRRMRSGLGATADYIFAKSIDDDSPGAVTIAQNWLDPRGERSLSSFDQRHLLKMQMQYTSGMGLGGGTLLGGWRGRALKEWTAVFTLKVGSGLPETPIYSAAVSGTAYTNVLRPSLTGASIYTQNAAARLNAAAYTAPTTGQWGNAGRYSITGPGQFSFDSTVARTFRVYKNTSLDLKAISTNLLNKVAYTSWNNYIDNAQFGLPLSTNQMRSVQIQMNLRFEK
jgi:hypothetical protein